MNGIVGFFFFQAEDGIRDKLVTGVQTCALPISGMTANGAVELAHTRIAELTIGSITLYDVDASINPGMDKDMPILLGMSVLKQLEMQQKDDTLILKQTY